MLVRITAVALLAATFTTAAAHAQDEAGAQIDSTVEQPPTDAAQDALLADAPMEPAGRPPEPIAAPAPLPVVPSRAYGKWDRLADCESGGNWHSASNPIYKGGVQMDSAFWRRYGGLQYASRADYASREQQIAVAERGLAVQGPGAWPICGRRTGLR